MESQLPPLKFPPPQPLLYSLKGVFALFFLLFCALFGSAVLHFPFLISQLISRRYWVFHSEFTTDIWFRFFLCYFEKLSPLKFVVTGDQIDPKDDLLIIANHPSEADWLYFWSFAARWHYPGGVKVVLKEMLRKVPGPGWVIDNLSFIFLSRSWKADKAQIQWNCKQIVQSPNRVFLCIFPEGTDFAPEKLQKGLQFAKQQGITHDYKHVLVPRTKGFYSVLRHLRPRLNTLYDFTFGYENGYTPTIWSAWTGWFPQVVHVHVRRYQVSDLPEDKEGLSKWCYDRFAEKDQLLRRFTSDGKFPGDKKPEWKDPRGLWLCGIGWSIFTIGAAYLFWTNFWFRTYVLVCCLFYTLSSFVGPLRVLRGLKPPPGFLSGQKKE